jgi:hypothetical protein
MHPLLPDEEVVRMLDEKVQQAAVADTTNNRVVDTSRALLPNEVIYAMLEPQVGKGPSLNPEPPRYNDEIEELAERLSTTREVTEEELALASIAAGRDLRECTPKDVRTIIDVLVPKPGQITFANEAAIAAEAKVNARRTEQNERARLAALQLIPDAAELYKKLGVLTFEDL